MRFESALGEADVVVAEKKKRVWMGIYGFQHGDGHWALGIGHWAGRVQQATIHSEAGARWKGARALLQAGQVTGSRWMLHAGLGAQRLRCEEQEALDS